MDAKRLVFYFDQGSLLPFILFIEGLIASYYFVLEDYSAGFLLMLIGFVTYAAHNILGKSMAKPSYFNEYLEDMGQFLIFGVSLIIFGLVYHDFDPFLLAALFFFSISVFFSLARSYSQNLKNVCGWPISLNGLFFPFFYYVTVFYELWESIFIIFYVVIGILSLTEYNFLSHRDFHELVGKTTHTQEEAQLHVNQDEHEYHSDERVENKGLETRTQEVVEDEENINSQNSNLESREEIVQPQVVNIEEEQVIVNNEEVLSNENISQEEVVENEKILNSQDSNLESQEEMDPQRKAELEAYVKDFTRKQTLVEKLSEKMMFWKKT